MRRGYTDSEFYIDEETKVFHGISLGYDYASEHERGIQDINKYFGMKTLEDGFLGIENRLIRQIPKGLRYIENKYKNSSYAHLIFDRYFYKNAEDTLPVSDLHSGEDFVTAWDDDSFGISVKGSNNPKRKLLKELYEAFLRLDVGIAFVAKSKNPFGRTCPFLGIVSRMDEPFLKSMYDFDFNLKQLKDAAAETGIEDYLKEKGCGWYSLDPAWTGKVTETTDNRVLKTNHKVIFYLNPSKQKENNSGWYTVEDLKLWGKGVGPIPVNMDKNAKDFILREE